SAGPHGHTVSCGAINQEPELKTTARTRVSFS
ncbi:MAG: hypothetical protein ACI8TF_001066, partial [Paracoccaceae bacterium]